MFAFFARILSWFVRNESFTSGRAKPTRTFKLTFFGGRVAFARGFHGNVTGKAWFFHLEGRPRIERLLMLTIRTNHHVETTLYFRFGQPRREKVDGKFVVTGKMWGIDINSHHILNWVLKLSGKKLSPNSWCDVSEAKWMGFTYSRADNYGNTFEQLFFLGHCVCIRI